MLIKLKGDATLPVKTGGSSLIAHIVNDAGLWGSGFVVPLGLRYPISERTYRAHSPMFPGQVDIIKTETPGIYVANMCAQHKVGYNALVDGTNIPPIRYPELYQCLEYITTQAIKNSYTIHMPYIGSVRSGGFWSLIELMIQHFAQSVDIYLYEYDQSVL